MRCVRPEADLDGVHCRRGGADVCRPCSGGWQEQEGEGKERSHPCLDVRPKPVGIRVAPAVRVVVDGVSSTGRCR